MSATHTRTRRRLLQGLAALGALEGLGITQLIQQALANGNNPQTQGLRKVVGDVRVNGKPATVGTLLQAGDTVSTGPGAEAVYVIGQDAYLQRESSVISFAAQALRVLNGKLLSVFGKGNKQINIPTATIGIRGTGCYIEAEPLSLGSAAAQGKTRTYFCLCYGTAEVTPNATPKKTESITTKHHDSPRWIYADPAMPNMMVDARIINHTDLELTMLESLVGRVPPFAGNGYGKTD